MYTKLNMIFYKFIMAEPNSGSPKWQQYSPASVVAGSRDSEDVAVVWSCLVVSVDRLSGFVMFGFVLSVVAGLLYDRAVPDSPRHCVMW